MPLYEYECEKCGHRFEKIQKFSDALETVCPKCGGALRKLMSSPAIQFKGSGFYITDYPKKDSAIKTPDKSSETKSEPAKPETKTESKPEAPKTETPKTSKTDT
jgi:putative FmdB family regulatory protein